MKKNITSIPDDNSFLLELEKTIVIFLKKENETGFKGAENSLLKYLLLISKIAKKEEPLKGDKEKYIAIQRILSDDPELFMAQKVSDLSYYFSYVFKMPI